jgi:hypothetical protein
VSALQAGDYTFVITIQGTKPPNGSYILEKNGTYECAADQVRLDAYHTIRASAVEDAKLVGGVEPFTTLFFYLERN